MLETVAWQTGGVCMECFVKGDLVRLREFEVLVRGTKVTLKVPQRKKRANKGRPETRRKVEHSKQRAMRRLRMLYPDVFDVLYAEERYRVGLHPVANRHQNHLADAVATYQPPETYDAAILTTPEP